MDFELSDEQRLLADNVGRLMREHRGDAARRTIGAGADGWSRDLWRRYADMGLLALPFAEADGGIGGGGAEMMIVMEALGPGVITEPYVASAVLAGPVLAEAASSEQKARLLPSIIDGSCIPALAHDDGDSPTTARREGADWVIDGTKHLVLHGDAAHGFVLSARGDGLALFWVEADAVGLTRENYRLIDGRGAADLRLNNLRLGADALLGGAHSGQAIVERAQDRAIAALAAEAVGVMAAAHDLTVEYLKTRSQFGTILGKFQALQHRAADMLVAIEQARSMMMFGAMMIDHPEAHERRQALAAVKVQLGRSARLVARHAIQLHGAIGVTAEYALSDYVQRLTVDDMLFGDAERHLARLAAGGGLFAAEG